jgi:phage shock protein PspC (stress-responsive transcriptional regulator)
MVAGVCAGLGQYLGIDPTLVRLFFVLLVLGNGAGVFVYLLLWFVLPSETAPAGTRLEDNVRASADEVAERARDLGQDLRRGEFGMTTRAAAVIGGAFILVGAIIFLQNLGFSWLRWFNLNLLWPLLLILAGIAIIFRRLKGD